jgi:hypothetical protein
MSTILNLVKIESSNEKKTAGLYSQLAFEIGSNQSNVHLMMVEGQDTCPSPVVWNRIMTGLKKALRALPDPLVFTGTRDYRPAYRAKSPLFIVQTLAEYNKEKKVIAEEREKQAKAIEAAAEQSNLEAQQALDDSMKPSDLAQALRDECARLGIPIASVLACFETEAA